MKDPKKVKAYNALYYASHKESEKYRTYSWRAANRAQYIAYMKEYHKRNTKRFNAYEAKRASTHPSYSNWKAMMNRCYNIKNKRYKNYGGRGIGVCNSWRLFSNYERDFGQFKPGPHYTVDRINNSGHYQLGNVQWLTNRQNAKKGGQNVSC